MTETITAPDYRALPDDALAAMLGESEGEAFDAIMAEMGRRDRADRMAKARKRLGDMRAEGDREAYAQYRAADDWCRGELLSRAGIAAGISDEQVLWRLPEAKARRWASPELNEFWDLWPRITPAGYVRQCAAERRAEYAAQITEREAITDGRDGTGPGLADTDPGSLRHGTTAEEAPQDGTAGPVQRGRRSTDCTEDSTEANAGTGGTGGPVRPVAREDGDDMEPDPFEGMSPAAGRKMPLDEARKFAGEIWWTPAEVHLDVYTAALAVSHTIASFNTVPRLLIKSKDMRTGKSTGTDVAEILGWNPWRVTTSTVPGLKSKFNEAAPPLILCEEIQKRFGVNGLTGSKDPLATFLLDGYRRIATTPLSVDRATVDVPAYCMAVLNGRGRAVHDDIEDRCIAFPAKRKPAGVVMARNSLDQDTWAEGALLRDALHAYVKALEPLIAQLQRKWKAPHPLFVDRLDQIWRPVYLIALASDIYERELWEKACAAAAEQGIPEPPQPACDWAERVMSGFRLLALDNSDIPPLVNEQVMLRDVARWFRSGGGWKDPLGRRFGFAADLKTWLVDESGESLWTQLTERRMEQLMTDALGETAVLTQRRADEPKRRARGWAAAPVLAGWDALEASWLPTLPDAAEEASIFDDLPPEDEVGADHSSHGTDSVSPSTG